ncbi:diacylglycerol/lipid kinase family protein [Aquirufa sp. ROCK2-A2]
MNKLEIAFLVNPLKTKAHTREYVLWVLEKSKEVTDIEITIQLFDQNWPESLALFDRIWLLGGDGTMCYFINQYPNCSQPISLFKGGTGNDFYWKIYKNISREDHFQSAIYGQIESVDAGICNGKYFLNGVGMGIEGEVLKSMKSIRILGGFLGYFLAAIPHIFTFKSYTIAYQDNHGKRIQKKVFLCMVFNSSRAGGGFLFAPMASIQDGKLNMLICDPIHILKRIIFMPTVQFGWHVHFPFVQTMEIDEITISADRVLRAQVDGEMLESNEFVFQVLPNHFQFCFPKL